MQKINVRSVEFTTTEDGRNVINIGLQDTSENKELVKKLLRKDSYILERPVDISRMIFFWENDDFAGMKKYLDSL